MPDAKKDPLPAEHIAQSIVLLRGQRVILDRNLAEIYGVSTSRLNEAVQAANVLNSPRAIAMGVLVVRAFIQLRGLLASSKALTICGKSRNGYLRQISSPHVTE